MILPGTRLAAGMLFLAMAAGAAGADIPYLSGRVVDDAEILSSAARGRLTGPPGSAAACAAAR